MKNWIKKAMEVVEKVDTKVADWEKKICKTEKHLTEIVDEKVIEMGTLVLKKGKVEDKQEETVVESSSPVKRVVGRVKNIFLSILSRLWGHKTVGVFFIVLSIVTAGINLVVIHSFLNSLFVVAPFLILALVMIMEMFRNGMPEGILSTFIEVYGLGCCLGIAVLAILSNVGSLSGMALCAGLYALPIMGYAYVKGICAC